MGLRLNALFKKTFGSRLLLPAFCLCPSLAESGHWEQARLCRTQPAFPRGGGRSEAALGVALRASCSLSRAAAVSDLRAGVREAAGLCQPNSRCRGAENKAANINTRHARKPLVRSSGSRQSRASEICKLSFLALPTSLCPGPSGGLSEGRWSPALLPVLPGSYPAWARIC